MINKLNYSYSANVPVIFASLFILLLNNCSNKNEITKENEKIQVEYSIATPVSYSPGIRVAGKLSAEDELKLSFKTGGVLQYVGAKEGDVVPKGALLASLSLDEIQAQVTQAELALEKAERDFQRVENLYRDSVVTLEQYQNARTAVEIARAQKSSATFNKSHSSIYAPTKGKILKILQHENEIIAPGHPVFLFASTNTQWMIKTSFPDRDATRLSTGDSANVYFDAYPDMEFKGYISNISPVADPFTGTFEGEVSLIEQPPQLFSGLIATIQITPTKKLNLLEIPVDAMLDGANREATIYKYTNKEAVKTLVQVYKITDSALLIKSGVSPGDTIITKGGGYITPASGVKLLHKNKYPKSFN